MSPTQSPGVRRAEDHSFRWGKALAGLAQFPFQRFQAFLER